VGGASTRTNIRVGGEWIDPTLYILPRLTKVCIRHCSECKRVSEVFVEWRMHGLQTQEIEQMNGSNINTSSKITPPKHLLDKYCWEG
jgi:hypothetical protein